MAYNDSTIKLAIDAYLQHSFVNGSFIKKVFHYKIMKYISICMNLVCGIKTCNNNNI